MDRLDLGGIPLFFAEGPEPAHVSLSFRVGWADERPVERGITHLFEHLALFGLGRPEHLFNGVVDELRCTFWAEGTQAELEAFLTGLTRSLVVLPLDRLETEKRVLRQESDGPAPAIVPRLLAMRYGTRGPGARVLPEFGLRWIGGPEVEAWRDRWFTTGNAALAFHGPRPPQAELALPAGDHRPPPDATPLPGWAPPAFIADGTGGVAASAVSPRTWAAAALRNILAETLFADLRLDRGLVYDVWVDRTTISATEGHTGVGADCADADAPAVMAGLVGAFERLAAGEGVAEGLERARRDAERWAGDDASAWRAALGLAVLDTLHGLPVAAASTASGELAAVTPDEVVAAAVSMRDSLLVLGPDGVPAPEGVPPQRRARPAPEGPVFETRGRQRGDRLRIGDAGVFLGEAGDQDPGVIPADEIALVTEADDGELRVHGLDGAWVGLWPDELEDPEGALDALGRIAPSPFIPVADDVAAAAAAAVDEIAADQLAHQWPVKDELAQLKELLRAGERPEVVAEATMGMTPGVLALTSRRLIFVGGALRMDKGARVPRADIRAAEAQRHLIRGRKLVITTVDGEQAEFENVKPKERASAFAEALGPPAGG